MSEEAKLPPVLTVGMLAKLVPEDTEIHFRDLGAGERGVYCPASSTDLIWILGSHEILLGPLPDRKLTLKGNS